MACGMVQQFWQLLIARMSVAVGEAGGMAPSVSMVSDLYPKERRSLVISILLLGPHLGLLAAMVLGGWIAQEYGWRYVFYVFGAPGVVLALLLWLIGRDPRGSKAVAPVTQSFVAQMSELLKIPGFLPLCSACAVAGMAGYGYGIWAPTFMVRNWQMSLAEAGLIFGIVSGVLAVLGSLFSALLCDHLSRQDSRWQIRLPLLGVLLGLPCGIAFLLWPKAAWWSIGGIAVPHAMAFAAAFSFFSSWWPTLSYAAVSHLTGDSQRATGAAVLNLFITLFGAGLGPLLTGLLSDVFAHTQGENGLRYGLAVTLATLLLSVLFYALAVAPYRRRMQALAPSSI